jgi:hypothetical protein
MAFLRSSPMVWRRRQQSDQRNIEQVATYNSTRVLPHRHGVHHPRSYRYKYSGFMESPNGYAPRTVPLNVPPSKDGPERIGAHTLTVHRDGFPTYVDRTRTGECRGVRPLLHEERVPGVEQHLGDATPSAPNQIPGQRLKRERTLQECREICADR